MMGKFASMNSKVISYSIFLLWVNRGPIKTAVFIYVDMIPFGVLASGLQWAQFVPIPRCVWLCALRPVCVTRVRLTWAAAPASSVPGSAEATPQPAPSRPVWLARHAPHVVRLALFPDNYGCLGPPRNEGQDWAQLLLQCQWNYEEFAPTHKFQIQRRHRSVGRGIGLFQWLLGGSILSSLELWRNSCPWDILWRVRNRRSEVSRR